MSNSEHLVIRLNERWRIVDKDGQWIVQQRRGKATKKSTGWRDRKFCKTREGVELAVSQLGFSEKDEEGNRVVPEPLRSQIAALPEHYNACKQREGTNSNVENSKKVPTMLFSNSASAAQKWLSPDSAKRQAA